MEATILNIADKTIELHAKLIQETTYWNTAVKVPLNVCKRHFVKLALNGN